MKAFLAKYGWKTISSAIALGVIAALQYLEVITPETADQLLPLFLGTGLIGLRLADKKES